MRHHDSLIRPFRQQLLHLLFPSSPRLTHDWLNDSATVRFACKNHRRTLHDHFFSDPLLCLLSLSSVLPYLLHTNVSAEGKVLVQHSFFHLTLLNLRALHVLPLYRSSRHSFHSWNSLVERMRLRGEENLKIMYLMGRGRVLFVLGMQFR